ncbi:hypothetical protein H257_07258 [Aphanomyces astaci]|uniref:Uncharacterized protein n=1 Tax=Aphanomyces astaci TaxID=112090 RepID=W4GHK3_APHAT|nr:hypothetical protein H257_07258 [Aphanomyces astaci]ETV79180.1 hypothetical protein H257_07258 [Aphanomyces astaci]|eukprot:XP_009831021.1 hypothetical protein H257_07258 [Aphanomyces astaci]
MTSTTLDGESVGTALWVVQLCFIGSLAVAAIVYTFHYMFEVKERELFQRKDPPRDRRDYMESRCLTD